MNAFNPAIASYPNIVNKAPIPPKIENLNGFLKIKPNTSFADSQKDVPFKATIV